MYFLISVSVNKTGASLPYEPHTLENKRSILVCACAQVWPRSWGTELWKCGETWQKWACEDIALGGNLCQSPIKVSALKGLQVHNSSWHAKSLKLAQLMIEPGCGWPQTSAVKNTSRSHTSLMTIKCWSHLDGQGLMDYTMQNYAKKSLFLFSKIYFILFFFTLSGQKFTVYKLLFKCVLNALIWTSLLCFYIFKCIFPGVKVCMYICVAFNNNHFLIPEASQSHVRKTIQ